MSGVAIMRLKTIWRAMRGPLPFGWEDYLLYFRQAEYPGPANRMPEVKGMEEAGEFVLLDIAGRRFYWPKGARYSSMGWVFQEVFAPMEQNSHAYEIPGCIEIKPGSHVVDAGASAGFFTRYALEKGAGRVTAIEALPAMAECLRRTFAAEIQEGRVRVLNLALGGAKGEVFLQSGSGELCECHVSDSGIAVPMDTVDHLFAGDPPDFIKMDIEGAECDVPKGAVELLRKHKPVWAVAVYHEVENAAIVRGGLAALRPDYQFKQRGIFAWDGVTPRPVMLYAK